MLRSSTLSFLFLFMFMILALGFIPSFFVEVGDWYENLTKPFWTPPNFIFTPVWITLYLLMGISLWVVWVELEKTGQRFYPYLFFGLQFLCNLFWSFLFFGLKSPFLALVDIFLLNFFLLVTFLLFYSISNWAAFLLLPYFFWVFFATTINFSIWMNNH